MLNKEKTITISLDEYNRLLESQKQVDELKDTLGLQKTLYNRAREDGYCTGYKSAVKDTAKEIEDKIQELLNTPFDGKTEKQEYQRKGMEEGLKMALEIVRECKGVEVE